jgi:uncharacterized protein
MQTEFRKIIWSIFKIPAYILIFLIKSYQKISPLWGGRCRFYPTCSQYSIDALSMHGLSKGSLLVLWRIFRCHPMCAGGLDPVPEKNLKEVI